MKALAFGLARVIGGYQRFLSPLLPRACRFAPSCSEYVRQALLERGLIGGSWLAARRLLRCHPFHPGGYDPLPPAGGGTPPRNRPRTWNVT